jgi:DNA repair exonuclease SbcCD nuclease subunit
MSKFLYYQDAHLKGINPARRTDNYLESWMIKFREVLSLAKKHKVEKVIDGGDFLHTPIVSNSIIDDVLDAIEENGIPFHFMFGNHSMCGANRETSNGTTLAHALRRSKMLSEGDLIQGIDHTIKLIDYSHGIETKLKEEPILLGPTDVWKILLIHAMVTEKSFRPDVLHVVADEIKTNADLCLISHFHQPWEKQIGNTKFLDIGAYGRCTIAEANIAPSVLLLDTKKRSYEVIKLKKAKAGSTVFDLTKKDIEDATDLDLDVFTNNLKDFKTSSLNLRDSVEIVGKEQNVERPVIDCILNKLTELELK